MPKELRQYEPIDKQGRRRCYGWNLDEGCHLPTSSHPPECERGLRVKAMASRSTVSILQVPLASPSSSSCSNNQVLPGYIGPRDAKHLSCEIHRRDSALCAIPDTSNFPHLRDTNLSRVRSAFVEFMAAQCRVLSARHLLEHRRPN